MMHENSIRIIVQRVCEIWAIIFVYSEYTETIFSAQDPKSSGSC